LRVSIFGLTALEVSRNVRYQGMGLRTPLRKLSRTKRQILPWTHQYNWHRPHSS
jgi:hypothetical protein